MRSVLIVPIDDQAEFRLKLALHFRYGDQSQKFLDSPMKSFDDSDGMDCLLHPICAMGSNPFK